MGLIRSIFRLGQQADDGVVPDRPIYPPEDTLTFGFEEVFVTLALLITSYIVLATPFFSKRSQARLGSRLNTGGWKESVKQLRHIRSMEDFKRWWQQLRQGRDDRRKFDPQQWNAMMRSSASLRLNDSDLDKTVRARGGRSAPCTPLRTFFRPVNNNIGQKMHSSKSEALLVSSPAKVELERLFSAEQKGDTVSGGEGGELFYDEDFRPETDHDRFEKAWESHIRFAEYRRLVLPPECKLVEFTSHLREAEQNFLENLLDESRLNKVISHARNIFDTLCGILAKLLSRESARQFSVWIMGVFRYSLRRQRGLTVEEDDETVDEDDGSVTTLTSNASKKPVKPGRNPKHPEITSVTSNRKNLGESTGSNGKGSLLDSVPQLHENITHQEDGHGNENDSSFMNVPPLTSSEKKRDSHAEKSSRPRFNTADSFDATFVSALGLENTDGCSEKIISLSPRSLDIPSSVEQLPKNICDVSPLPMKHFHKQKKKDALENYRKPDIARISVPLLKSTSDPDPLPESISPMPLPKIKPQNPSTNLDDAHCDSTNMNFFDTANSDRQLRDMSRAVPIPDANGYILGDEFLSSSCTPLLVFVNSRSGPQQGNLLITQFRRLLNPIQVWDLANGGPEKVLKSFSVLTRFQILVCGGDGTVSWIISALEGMGLKRWPPIGILPLGTGNDLARIHGWGGGYNHESLVYILRQLSEAYISMLDLWELDITSTTKKGKQRKEVKAFINYLGVGVDAQAAMQVHMLRESKPKLFFSRFFNKAWYAMAGGEEVIKSSCANLSQQITLMADGIEIPLPPNSQGIIFLNIDSYSGGVPLWSKGLKPRKKRVRRYSESDFLHANGNGLTRNDSIEDLAELEASRELTACDLPSSCQDGLLDVVSIRGAFHLGQIRVGLSNAQLLCQCREATVTLKKKVAVQIDGEPWRQNPSTIRITRKPDRSTMLNRSAEDNGGVETEVTKLLNWANEREVIDRKQYTLLTEEFSRRTEHKKRTQKGKSNGFSFVG
mmetsp:Transcript_31728/g.57447  ORF Transcript_31728/g.57447 Transcript_31728/m.57447 type:complete len:1007 (-) Transcript_31728:1024-4044(-)|eukprot:CAMPEP_0201896270 /NCGR_PEP_ID=MMETSP0902-20130614/44274_1 /ASSEMBLY_ACC=CAM_ASM_000551 /TAXON_ID=420261 /ORGANISM="Thalassiosira antarctica, Strain CCMP982" /LENGTH=1006 /DNA_ID=CAMNT_0048428819 /DNA_START=120 /DNA_END=3140 /DNA_ORIENTATION=+